MHIFRSAYIRCLKKLKRPTALSIGNFDGIHKGHQYIFAHLVKFAKTHGAYATIICFEPQPKEFFAQKWRRPALPRFVIKCLL